MPLITALGVPTRIEWGDTPGQGWRLEQTVDRTDNGKLKVVTDASYAGKRVSLHTGYLGSGEAFNLEFGGNGTPTLRMVRTVRLLPPDFKLSAQAATKPQ